MHHTSKLIFTLLNIVLFLLFTCNFALTVTNKVILDNFERTSPVTWTFYNGAEFPGASGSLSLAPNQGYGSSTALKLSFNLTAGNYVSTSYHLPQSQNFNILGFKLLAPVNNNFGVRVSDQTGQNFQFKALRLFEQYEREWIDVMVNINSTPGSSWGGAADGIIHFPIKDITILTEISEKGTSQDVGYVLIDDVFVSNQSMIDLNITNFVKSPFVGQNEDGIDMLSRMGVNIHFTSDDKGLDAVKAGGFSWIRMDLFWSSVETTKQVYNFANYDTLLSALKLRGLKALFILTYSNALYTGSGSVPPTTEIAIQGFANYSRAAAKHFAGEDVIFEVYNEADLQGFTGVTYAALSKAAVAAIREGNPNAQVSTTGVAGFSYAFVRGFTAEGGAASSNGNQLFSGIGLHPYGVGSPKSPYGRFPGLVRKFRSIINDNINATLQGKSTGLTNSQQSLISTVPPVWDTEWGLTTTDFDSNSNGLDETALRLHANNVAGRLLSSCVVGFPIYIYYDLRNDGLDPANREHNFGLLFNNYTDKPAMKVVKQLSSMVRNRLFDGYIQVEHPSVTAMRFKSSNDSVIVLLPTETGASVVIKVNNASSVVDVFGRPVSVASDNTFTLKETEGLVYVTYITPKVTPVVLRSGSSAIPQTGNSTKISSGDRTIGNWVIISLLLALSLFIQ